MLAIVVLVGVKHKLPCSLVCSEICWTNKEMGDYIVKLVENRSDSSGLIFVAYFRLVVHCSILLPACVYSVYVCAYSYNNCANI